MKPIFLSLLVLSFVDAFTQIGESEKTIEIPIEIADGGYLFISVTINDKETARFMLDTGAGINVISSSLFQKIQATLTPMGNHTGTRHNGETITGPIYKTPSISIGNFRKTDVVVGEYSALNQFDGLLSMNFFKETPFTIDLLNSRLIIENVRSTRAIKSNAEKIPLRVKNYGSHATDLFVTICLNDSLTALAEFDTGAGFNMLMVNTSYLKKMSLTVPEKKVQDMNYYIHSTTLPKLSCCGSQKLVQRNVFIGFKEGLIYEALVGSGMFRNRKLTINIPEGEMYVRE